jgi:hypothetical protein
MKKDLGRKMKLLIFFTRRTCDASVWYNNSLIEATRRVTSVEEGENVLTSVAVAFVSVRFCQEGII